MPGLHSVNSANICGCSIEIVSSCYNLVNKKSRPGATNTRTGSEKRGKRYTRSLYTTIIPPAPDNFNREVTELYVPEPKKLKSGSYFIQLRLNGVSVPVTDDDPKSCKAQARMIKAEYLAGKRQFNSATTDMTIRQAIDGYIKAKQNSLSPATIRGYRIIQKNRFQKHMDSAMKSIKSWQAVYDAEIGRLNPKTLHNSFGLLKSVYLHYFKTPMPAIKELPVAKKERPFFDADQIEVFLEAVQGTRCEIAALLALSSLRCSEILDLDWEDVDLKNDRLAVHGAAVVDEHNKLVHKDTNKTAASWRYVPIFMDQLHDALEAVQDKSGQVVHYQTESGMIRAINGVCAANDLPLVGVHGLRHSFASLCVHLGIPEETAMSIGGWSDFTTMRKIYTHISQRDRQTHTDLLKGFYNKNANENANEPEKV